MAARDAAAAACRLLLRAASCVRRSSSVGRRGRSSSFPSSSASVGLGGRLGRRLGRRLGAVRVGIGGDRRGRAAAAVVAGDHDDRDHQADDHRDQAGDEQAHVAVRVGCSRRRRAGPSSGSGPSCIASAPPVRVSRRGSRCVSSISKPLRSALSISSRLLPDTAIWVASRRAPARAASAGPAAAAVGARRRRPRPASGGRSRRRLRSGGSSSSASARRRSATIRSARALRLLELRCACSSASSITFAAARSAASTIAARRSRRAAGQSAGLGWSLLAAHLAA